MEKVGIITNKEDIKRYIGVNEKQYAEKENGLDNEATFSKNFKEWRCNLRLGREIYISSDDSPKCLEEGGYVIIRPGDFVLLLTRETLHLDDDVMGFISMRFDYKQKGLINVSGFHVDPNYHGKLIFSAFNAGPKDIVLRESDPVFMIFFERMDYHCRKKRDDGFQHIPADLVEQIQGKSATLSSNSKRLDQMEFYLKIVGSVAIGSVVSIIGFVINKIFWFYNKCWGLVDTPVHKTPCLTIK